MPRWKVALLENIQVKMAHLLKQSKIQLTNTNENHRCTAATRVGDSVEIIDVKHSHSELQIKIDPELTRPIDSTQECIHEFDVKHSNSEP